MGVILIIPVILLLKKNSISTVKISINVMMGYTYLVENELTRPWAKTCDDNTHATAYISQCFGNNNFYFSSGSSVLKGLEDTYRDRWKKQSDKLVKEMNKAGNKGYKPGYLGPVNISFG